MKGYFELQMILFVVAMERRISLCFLEKWHNEWANEQTKESYHWAGGGNNTIILGDISCQGNLYIDKFVYFIDIYHNRDYSEKKELLKFVGFIMLTILINHLHFDVLF